MRSNEHTFVRVAVEAPSDALLFRFHGRVIGGAEMTARDGKTAEYAVHVDRLAWLRRHAEDLGVSVKEAS